jgi:hypothetical protein
VHQLVPHLAELAITLASLLSAYVLNRVQQWLRCKVDNERARGMLLRLTDAVENAVLEVEQTTAEALRNAAEDGHITDEEARNVRQTALTAAKRQLGTRGVAELRKVLGDDEVDELIGGRLEAHLARIKRGVLAAGPSGG